MIQIEITGATGTGPYDIYVCDTTLTYCVLAGSGVNFPPNFLYTLVYPLDVVNSVIIKLIDSNGCEFIEVYSCPTPTPTPTQTLTPTPTNAQCNCIQFENTDIIKLKFGYTQCDGTVFNGLIDNNTILYVCGNSPFADAGVLFSVGNPCIDDACRPIPPLLSQTPTPTVTPTVTPTPTLTPTPSAPCTVSYWEVVMSGGGNFTFYSCGGGTNGFSTFFAGTYYVCSSLQPTSSSPNFVSATNVGPCP
jgi:hypothetical protein